MSLRQGLVKSLISTRAYGRFLHRGDFLILLALIAFLYAGTQFAPKLDPSDITTTGTQIELSAEALPSYAVSSLLRMMGSYVLSLSFALVYGYFAARSITAGRIMMPILDILQSVPILSFLPVVFLILTTVLPGRWGVEIAAVVLIFTSQAWNIAYSFHQSLRTEPRELQEAAATFRMNWWYRLRHLELPFALRGLLWNSVVSWANGWFFLMAAETFRVNNRDFRLPGLGSYLQQAANAGDTQALLTGFAVLVVLVVLLDQLLWRPLLTWAERFRTDLSGNDDPPTSWFLNLISKSFIAAIFLNVLFIPLLRLLDNTFGGAERNSMVDDDRRRITPARVIGIIFSLLVIAGIGFLVFQAASQLISLPIARWGELLGATAASTARVIAASVLGLLWTVPFGVWIGTNPRLATFVQPVIQSIAAFPATALFPVLVLFFVRFPAGLDISAVLLMMLGTQWYLLFNVIAGASALPSELKDAANLYKITGWQKWRTLILPAILPYIITGLNIVGGGAWNASIVAEYTQFQGEVYTVTGLGATIGQATSNADYPMLLAATVTMIITVVLINALIWQPLYRLTEEKFRLD